MHSVNVATAATDPKLSGAVPVLQEGFGDYRGIARRESLIDEEREREARQV